MINSSLIDSDDKHKDVDIETGNCIQIVIQMDTDVKEKSKNCSKPSFIINKVFKIPSLYSPDQFLAYNAGIYQRSSIVETQGMVILTFEPFGIKFVVSNK